LALELAGIGVQRVTPTGKRRAVLGGVDLRVAPGEHVAIVGPSGAGKTSLLQIAACALRPDSGVVRLDGSDPWACSARARRRLRHALFLAPQTPPLPPRQRVVTAVLAGRLPGMGLWRSFVSWLYPGDIAGAAAALAPFGLEGRLFDRVDRLSGGERQRVALARLWLAPARIWLLDEPLGALDPARAAEVIDMLCGQARRRGVTLVMAMHQVELAKAHFPRLVGLRGGTVAFDQTAGTLAPEQWRALYDLREGGPRDAARTAAASGAWAGA